MKRNLIISTLLLAIAFSSCSKIEKTSSVAENTPMDETTDVLREAVKQHDRKQLSSIVDSMAFFADDLTASQSVSVLMGYYELHRQHNEAHRYKANLEAMRNFVDVYDIAKSKHGDSFKRALAETATVYDNIDFEEVYKEFVQKLSNYDGGYPQADNDPGDSLTADSIVVEEEAADILPPELRPAD